MHDMPAPETYEESLAYWPYQETLAGVVDRVVSHAPKNGSILDAMCGSGYVLGEIAKKRPDLMLVGMDSDDRYISFGKKTYPGITFETGDVLVWKPDDLFHMVICTGSVHHIPYELQETAIQNIGSMTKPGGTVIISDCFVDAYTNEHERKLAVAKLGYEYLKVTIENGAPNNVIEWTTDILYNDVLMHEFKVALNDRSGIYKKYFEVLETVKVWPKSESEYGEYISVLRMR